MTLAGGRQQNRRVELVVSGEVIGNTVGAGPAAMQELPPAPRQSSGRRLSPLQAFDSRLIGGQAAPATCPSTEAPPLARSSLKLKEPIFTFEGFGPVEHGQGELLSEIKIRDYICGLLVTIVGIGLYSYYVRELMAALTLFSMQGIFLCVSCGARRASCLEMRRRASRHLGHACVAQIFVVFSRRLIAAYARASNGYASRRKIRDCAQVNRRRSYRCLGCVWGKALSKSLGPWNLPIPQLSGGP